MAKAKRINVKKGSFVANGKTYLIQPDEITISRYETYEKVALQVGWGYSFEDMFEAVKKMYHFATTGESPLKALHEIAIICMNLLNGVKDYEEREHPLILRFCTLFINQEGEDLTKWSETLALDKIMDWQKEGIAMTDFFLCSTLAIRGFLDAYPEAQKIKKINQPT